MLHTENAKQNSQDQCRFPSASHGYSLLLIFYMSSVFQMTVVIEVISLHTQKARQGAIYAQYLILFKLNKRKWNRAKKEREIS